MKTISAMLLAATCALSLPSSEARASVATDSKVGAFSISFMGINLSFGVRRYYAPRRHYASSPRRQHTRSTPRQETRSVERVVPSPSAVDNALRPSRVTVPAS
jgi:hypothetical protein